MKYDIAAPEPAGMVASLSSLGYSLPAAVADLVDNSISVEARTIDVEFTWAGADSWIAVVDDGWGMTVEELVTAMTVAARGPATPRSATDLGRFGVGLKSASFSQARQLTVSSAKVDGQWHVDGVAASPGDGVGGGGKGQFADGRGDLVHAGGSLGGVAVRVRGAAA
ncbi:ATP-binding protein [Streptomyces hirsutus]|uniref:ATP-binding protein n=1 Tax=Streptomyces hirsutus TaxID=35620 RepID=UPI0033E8BCBD